MPSGIYIRTSWWMKKHGKTMFKKGHATWNKGMRGVHFSPNTEFKKGQKPWNTGKTWPKKIRLKMSNAKIGKSLSVEHRMKLSKTFHNNPELCHSWKGGVTPINNRIRRSLNMRLWRTAIFMRDDYTCVSCHQRGGRLHADHVKPFALYPNLRFKLSNGRTLCVKCHKRTKTYGFKFLHRLEGGRTHVSH